MPSLDEVISCLVWMMRSVLCHVAGVGREQQLTDHGKQQTTFIQTLIVLKRTQKVFKNVFLFILNRSFGVILLYLWHNGNRTPAQHSVVLHDSLASLIESQK